MLDEPNAWPAVWGVAAQLGFTVAPEVVEAMTAILERHAGVRALFDNGWLHLFALKSG